MPEPDAVPKLSMTVFAGGHEVYLDEADLRVCWSYIGDGEAAFPRFLELLRFMAIHGQHTER